MADSVTSQVFPCSATVVVVSIFHTDVHRPLPGLAERDEPAVGRERRGGELGVAEEQLAVDQRGEAGEKAPWHLDPAETRLVDVAIEVCDGRPSYVERNQSDYPTYCPWGARVIARRP